MCDPQAIRLDMLLTKLFSLELIQLNADLPSLYTVFLPKLPSMDFKNALSTQHFL